MDAAGVGRAGRRPRYPLLVHFIVTSNGSYGDVYPLFGLAHALAGRGHEVTLVSNERYAPLAGDLEFVVGSSDAALEETIDLFDVSSAFSSAGALLHGLLVGPMREFHRAIVDEIRPGESAIVAFPLVLGARLAHDQLGVPFVSCQLAPSAFRSVLDPPRTTAMAQPTWMPGFMLRGLFGLLDRMVDRWTKADVNAYRAELGLAPARGILSWMDSPQKVLGLFPDWFGAPQDDWPAHVEATAFPQFDAAAARPMDESLSRFLDAGPPPIVLTAGSPAKGVGGFYRHAADACERLGRRGVLVTRYADDVPRELPDGVVHASYAPFSDLLPRAAALVHHGGWHARRTQGRRSAGRGVVLGVALCRAPRGAKAGRSAEVSPNSTPLAQAHQKLPNRFILLRHKKN